MNLKDYIAQHKNEFDHQEIGSKTTFSFEKQLRNSFHKPAKSKVFYLKYVAVAACVVLIVFTGIQYQHQQEQKEQLLADLGATSTGKRLEGIYLFSDEYVKEDKQIIDTLVKILHTDNNANVKIATIDALLKFPANEKIRKNLIIALEKEKQPLVQIKLITSVSFLREKRAQKSLKKIIDSEQTFPIVKSNAALAMNQLKN